MLALASWYEPQNWRGKLLRISNTAGRRKGLKKSIYNWGVVPCLIPDWSLVKAFRAGKITKEEYSEVYLSGLQEKWDEVFTWLNSLGNDKDITLLCHEREGVFCHRILVAEIVKKHRPDIQLALY